MQCCYQCLLDVSSVEFSEKPLQSHSTVLLLFFFLKAAMVGSCTRGTACDTDGLKWGCPWGCSAAPISDVQWMTSVFLQHKWPDLHMCLSQHRQMCARGSRTRAALRVLRQSCWLEKWPYFVSPTVASIAVQHPPRCRLQRWYFLSSSDCHMFFLSGKRSGILICRKSWMHFSSSCSGVIFSLFAFLFAASRSRTPKVLTLSMSVLRRISACCSLWTGPLGVGRSSVWALGRRIIGPQITVPWGELASDWVSEQEVESSLKEVPLSPSCSLLWLLQQQSQWEDSHLEGPPEKERNADTSFTSHSRFCAFFPHRRSVSPLSPWWQIQVIIKRSSGTDPAKANKRQHSSWDVKQISIQHVRCMHEWVCVCAGMCVWVFPETQKSSALTFNC